MCGCQLVMPLVQLFPEKSSTLRFQGPKRIRNLYNRQLLIHIILTEILIAIQIYLL